jgi:hypothetical protein
MGLGGGGLRALDRGTLPTVGIYGVLYARVGAQEAPLRRRGEVQSRRQVLHEPNVLSRLSLHPSEEPLRHAAAASSPG